MQEGSSMDHADNGWRASGWRKAMWAGVALLLAAPLAAMQFTAEVQWSAIDFATMGVMLAMVGLGLDLAMLKSGSLAYRAAAILAVAASFLLVWVNLAVGFLGDEGNPANLMFAGVLAVALAGSAMARFRPAGMARAMLVTAFAQGLVAAIALAAGWTSPGPHGLYEVTLGTSLFAGLWLASAGLFWKAAQGRSVVA
jgi:hypothetical protein